MRKVRYQIAAPDMPVLRWASVKLDGYSGTWPPCSDMSGCAPSSRNFPHGPLYAASVRQFFGILRGGKSDLAAGDWWVRLDSGGRTPGVETLLKAAPFITVAPPLSARGVRRHFRFRGSGRGGSLSRVRVARGRAAFTQPRSRISGKYLGPEGRGSSVGTGGCHRIRVHAPGVGGIVGRDGKDGSARPDVSRGTRPGPLLMNVGFSRVPTGTFLTPMAPRHTQR